MAKAKTGLRLPTPAEQAEFERLFQAATNAPDDQWDAANAALERYIATHNVGEGRGLPVDANGEPL